MVRFLLGIVTAAGFGKWIETKTSSKPLEYISDAVLLFILFRLMRR